MTSTAWVVVGAGVVVLLLLAWAVWTLTRLRRLAGRVTRAWDVLLAALARRAELAAALARESPGELGPGLVHALERAAVDARAPGGGDREVAENVLGRVLREVPAELRAAELDDAGWRVGLARRFYNDAVRDTRSLRRRPIARVLRLHARRPLPRFFDIDDGLDAVGAAAGGRGGA
ncbi:MAG: uncharacterized protein JWQ53_315 [Klenkia sp.]|nr:uncharacterized protein [Klenkia sp.]